MLSRYKYCTTATAQLHWLCTGDVFGNRAIELAGRAIDPAYQSKKLGSLMLQAFLDGSDAEYISTYTRNPAVLRMIRTIAHTIYPINDDKMLEKLAKNMPHAEQPTNDVVYHLHRYGAGGLYGGDDPANQPYFTNGTPLKKMYHQLADPGTALVVTARVMPHLVEEALSRATDITNNQYNGEQDD